MNNKKLPAKGMGREKLFSLLNEMKSGDTGWEDGHMFSLIYNAGADVEKIAREAYASYMIENALSPFSFPSLLKMENEVMSMIAGMFNGKEAVGSMTSGGSESILMAVKTARDWARDNRPDIKEPELLMPVTAHPAFNKAAHYLGLKAVIVPVDKEFRADMDAVREAVNENTAFMVGTAFTYPHGMVDPIEEMSEIAEERNIWLHTDSCLGGFILPFMKKSGYKLPEYDFSLNGVKSISADIHKYGYTPKGASTVLYRNIDLRKYQIFAYADWPGGVYGTQCVSGARPGGAVASAWAVMHYLGEDGFCRLTEKAVSTARKMMDGAGRIQGLYVLGSPEATVFSIASDTINIYDIQDRMKKRNWNIESQHLPASLHVTVSPVHEKIVGSFLSDLEKASAEAVKVDDKDRSEEAVIYGIMGTLPDRSQARKLMIEYLNDIYTLKG